MTEHEKQQRDMQFAKNELAKLQIDQLSPRSEMPKFVVSDKMRPDRGIKKQRE